MLSFLAWPNWLRAATIAGILIVAFWVATAVIGISFLGPFNSAGEFGDAFGAVNALFADFAFLGVVVAIILQREKLELQRTELANTRLVLQLNNQMFKQQIFEQSFYAMLREFVAILTCRSCGVSVESRVTGEGIFFLRPRFRASLLLRLGVRLPS